MSDLDLLANVETRARALLCVPQRRIEYYHAFHISLLFCRHNQITSEYQPNHGIIRWAYRR